MTFVFTTISTPELCAADAEAVVYREGQVLDVQCRTTTNSIVIDLVSPRG